MSIFHLLSKRRSSRELSAKEFIAQAVTAEASGQSDKIDVGKLEAHMQTVGWSLEQFEAAVARQREVDRLRAITASKADANKAFRTAADRAAQIRRDHEAEIRRLQGEIEQAEQAVVAARVRVDRISIAEQELRQFESQQSRSERTVVKQRRSELLATQRELNDRVQAAQRDLSRIDGTMLRSDFSDDRALHKPKEFRTQEQRDKYVDSRKQTIATATERLATLEAEIAAIDERLAESERELIGV